MTLPPLTPYDTGARLEPHLWSTVQAPDDAFGRVDFDNEESITEFTVWIEREGDGYTLHVANHGGNPLRMEET